jgi:hypothetical protein
MIDTELPERINVMKVLSFDVESIQTMLAEFNASEVDYVATETEVMDVVMREAYEYFGGSSDLIFQDENGEELDY